MSIILKTLKITSTEIKLWFYAFVTLCLFLSPLLFNFIWGNHDWLPVINDNHLTSGLIEGRFSQYILLTILLMGKVLPILNTLFGLALYSLAKAIDNLVLPTPVGPTIATITNITSLINLYFNMN